MYVHINVCKYPGRGTMDVLKVIWIYKCLTGSFPCKGNKTGQVADVASARDGQKNKQTKIPKTLVLMTPVCDSTVSG